MPDDFTFSGRIRSIGYAFEGIWIMLKSQQNAWVHAVASVCVIIAGFIFHLTPQEWCWIVLAIVAVWTAETFNTAFEFLCDVASPEFHPLVKKSKDVSAGAVLIAAIGAIVIGFLIFSPKAIRIFEQADSLNVVTLSLHHVSDP